MGGDILKKTIKAITVATMIICFFIFGLIAFTSIYLPSSYNVSKINSLDRLSIFGISVKNESTNTKDVSNNLQDIETTKGKLMLGNIIPIKSVDINITENTMVIPGGTPFGIKVFTNGVMVVKIDKINVNSHSYTPAEDANIKIGDVILEVNGKSVTSNEDLVNCVNKCNGDSMNIILERNEQKISTKLTPVNSGNEQYKIGVWVRDSSAGIGTITFYEPKSGGFAGLGHGICDVDTGSILPLGQGEIVGARIDGITMAQSGKAGTLNGHIESGNVSGYVTENKNTGVYGVLNNCPTPFDPVSVAFKQEVTTGKSQIITTLDDNKPQYYDIEIESINYDDDCKTKNLVIKITDEKLLSKTNGIVQGMSGSPIIQNGKLVGAVTHVFVNEPQKGYGIFAENMLLDFDKENQIQEEPAA